jgi:cholesterol oxidase
MTYWLSEPIESLFRDQGFSPASAQVNVAVTQVEFLIIGSGYGAAMTALALLEHKKANGDKPQVWVLERGDEYVPADFPKTIDDLPNYLNFVSDKTHGPRMANIQKQTGLWDIRSGPNVSVLSGSGLGGTSLVNANVASRPRQEVLDAWPAPEFGSGVWSDQLNEVFPKIEALLGVKPTPGAENFSKYDALKNSVDCMEGDIAPANVSINFEGWGPHSVDTGECNRCGNCVIGCHSGAKQSLNMNAWPLARQMGGDKVKLYTGVCAKTVNKAGSADFPWSVTCELTRKPKIQFAINAKHVILAAGSLGSVEILKRSRKAHNLSLSAMLGDNFSTNGDALISSVGQSDRVNATCDVPGKIPPEKEPGPSIIGKAEVNLKNPAKPNESFTLEDGVIPFPLISLWQELIVTLSFFRRFTESSLSAWHDDHDDHDYLAISPDLNDHSQVLLVMGDDRTRGKIEFDELQDTALPSWDFPSEGEYDYFKTLDACLKSSEEDCMDGGQYFPNPLWQPLPAGFEGVVSGADQLSKSLLSVHPLGGCSIASSATDGVVNTRGQVFDSSHGNSVHEGLYVLDGAIIPGAIGTNPYMTIAGTSYLMAYELAKDELDSGPDRDTAFPFLDKTATDYKPIPPGSLNPIPDDNELKLEGVFKERLVHHLGRSALLPWSVKNNFPVSEINYLFSPGFTLPDTASALVLDIEFEIKTPDHLDSWLENPDRPLAASATLSYDQFGSSLTISSEHLMPIAKLKGTVNLGIIDEPFWLFGGRFGRFLVHVVDRFWKYRRSELGGGSLSDIAAAVRVGKLHTDFREMEYEFESDPSDPVSAGLKIELEGKKRIAYSNEQPNIWDSLLTLDTMVRSRGSGSNRKRKIDWEIDTVDITKKSAPLQVIDSLNLLTLLAKIGGAMAYFLRVALQTHFWSFGAPDYEKYKTKEQIDRSTHDDLPASWSRFFEPPPARQQ